MKIVLLGGAGYVGQVLLHRLIKSGHEVKIIDIFKFLSPSKMKKGASWTMRDTRMLRAEDLAGADAVCDLSAISNDPAGELDPMLTYSINVEARARTAGLAKHVGVRRHLLFSSCSVYGVCEELADEEAETRPLTEYAMSNARAEERVLALADRDFCTTAFRLATVFGPSPAMRFDLVVNTMTRNAIETGLLTVTGGGEQFRPLIHVGDVADAAIRVLGMPPTTVCGEIFNLVHCNARIRDVADAVVRGLRRPVAIRVENETIDRRDYQVDGTKALRLLGFEAERTIEQAACDIMKGLRARRLDVSPRSIRLNGYREMAMTQAAVF